MALRVVVSGATGRMGGTLRRMIAADPGLELVGGLDRDDASDDDSGATDQIVGLDAAADLLRRTDVLIDFSAPEFLGRLLREHGPLLRGKAILVGTTGLGEAEEQLLQAASAESPVLVAANFSVSVNLLLVLAEQAAGVLGPEYDVEIVEAHHRRKEDAPSGTALALGEAVARGRDVELAAVRRDGRTGRPGARPSGEIGFHAVRGGGVVGEHDVMFIGELDRLTLSHHAADRSLFAAGALRGAQWLSARPPGRYSMRDVLGLP